jgi:hypothetical protein
MIRPRTKKIRSRGSCHKISRRSARKKAAALRRRKKKRRRRKIKTLVSSVFRMIVTAETSTVTTKSATTIPTPITAKATAAGRSENLRTGSSILPRFPLQKHRLQSQQPPWSFLHICNSSRYTHTHARAHTHTHTHTQNHEEFEAGEDVVEFKEFSHSVRFDGEPAKGVRLGSELEKTPGKHSFLAELSLPAAVEAAGTRVFRGAELRLDNSEEDERQVTP